MAEHTERSEEITETTETASLPIRRNSWGAIFGGMFIALAIMLTLDLLSLAVGLTVVNPVEGNNLTHWGVGAAIWWVVAAWIGFYFGGMFAGWMSGFPRAIDAVAHGFATWAFTAVVMLFLLSTTIGAIAGGALGLARTTGQTTSNAIAAPFEGSGIFGQGRNASWEITPAVATDIESTATPSERREKKAARTSAGVAWAAFVMLVIGAGLTALGAYSGRPSHMLGRRHRMAKTEHAA